MAIDQKTARRYVLAVLDEVYALNGHFEHLPDSFSIISGRQKIEQGLMRLTGIPSVQKTKITLGDLIYIVATNGHKPP